MTQATQYEDLMNTVWDNIPTPKVLPAGSWRLRCRNAIAVQPKEEGKSGQIVFFYEAVEPMDDVQQDELQALGNYDYGMTELSARFFVSPKDQQRDMHKVRLHLQKHGVEFGPGMTLQNTLKAARNTDVIAMVTAGPNTKTGDLENKVGQVVSVQ